MAEPLSRFVLEFLRSTERPFALLLAVIDAAGVGDSARPVLNLWAFNVFDGDDFDAALNKAREHGDIGHLFDVLDEVASSEECFALDEHYTSWPDDPPERDQQLVAQLAELARTHPDELEKVQKGFYLQYVDDLELMKISR
jgi:hypothetical protein